MHRDGQRFVLSISSFGGLAVRGEAACELDEARGELRWTMKIGNDAPGTVVGVIGPCLRNVQDLPGGVLAIPNRPGHRIRDPWKTLAASVQHLEYPVPASMQYMAYSSSIGGIAVHVLDREMVYKQLAFGGAGRQMTFIQYPFVAHGGQWTSPSVVWQVLSQDWHQAADRYRAWFRSWAEKPQVSRRLAACPWSPRWVLCARPKDDPVLKDVLKSMELRTVRGGARESPGVLAGGLRRSPPGGMVWAGARHHVSGPRAGRGDGWRGGAFEARRRAPREPSARGLLPQCASAQRHQQVVSVASRVGMLTQDGPRREPISTEVFHVACPASPGYQCHLENEVLRVASRYGGDGVQLDQIGAAWSVLCFDKSHGHRTPATAWAEGYTHMLKEVRSAVRKVKPDFFCWVEGVWEGASQYVDLSQGGFWPDHPGSEPFPEMYRYTLPEHPLFGDARIGGVPYWCPSDIARALRINAEASSFFWDAEFRDTVGLLIDNGGEARWFRKDSQALVTLFNPHDRPRELAVRLRAAEMNWHGQLPTAKVLAAGIKVPVSLDGSSIRLSVKVRPPRGRGRDAEGGLASRYAVSKKAQTHETTPFPPSTNGIKISWPPGHVRDMSIGGVWNVALRLAPVNPGWCGRKRKDGPSESPASRCPSDPPNDAGGQSAPHRAIAARTGASLGHRQYWQSAS